MHETPSQESSAVLLRLSAGCRALACGSANGGEVSVVGIIPEEAPKAAGHLQAEAPSQHRRQRPARFGFCGRIQRRSYSLLY